jgi:uncharacterized protein YqgC (DUF456 family)
MAYVWYGISVILILAGLAGIFLPVVPGIPVVLAGMLLLGFVGHFISGLAVGVLVALTLISVLMDYFSGALGAKFSGAGLLGMAGAILGAIFGFAILGFIGMLIGPALGVLIFELLTKRNIKKAPAPRVILLPQQLLESSSIS